MCMSRKLTTKQLYLALQTPVEEHYCTQQVHLCAASRDEQMSVVAAVYAALCSVSLHRHEPL